MNKGRITGYHSVFPFLKETLDGTSLTITQGNRDLAPAGH